MLELFQGFGLDSWSMCDVVLPALKECFPSCVRGFNTPLCHSSMSYREQGKMCITILFVVKEHVCDKYRQIGRWAFLQGFLAGGMPPWFTLVLQCCVSVCGHTLAETHCLTWWEVWGVLFQPIHIPVPPSRILK